LFFFITNSPSFNLYNLVIFTILFINFFGIIILLFLLISFQYKKEQEAYFIACAIKNMALSPLNTVTYFCAISDEKISLEQYLKSCLEINRSGKKASKDGLNS
ncbi:MAG: hypothetical protein K8R77_05040, partial [Anaerolineaceae bacterium]|nr:hypothetical protein [Anaerolineaceae bacterium]